MQRLFLAQSNNRTLYYSWGTWLITRNTGTGNILAFHDPPSCELWAGDYKTVSFWIFRPVMAFDTSPMSDTAIIVSANIIVYVTHIDTTTPARPWLYLVKGIQNIPVIGADYGGQNTQLEILGQVKVEDLVANAYNSIPLNAAGLAHLSLIGLTRLGLRGQNDLEDYESLHIYRNYIKYHSQQKGIGYRPYLEINYYPA